MAEKRQHDIQNCDQCEEELKKCSDSLEEIDGRRTAQLEKLNEDLQREVAERKKTEAELEQRSTLLSTLLDVSNMISSTLELRPLLEAVLDRLRTIIDYRDAQIFSIDENIAEVIAQRSSLAGKRSFNHRLPLEKIPWGCEIVNSKRPLLIPDLWEQSSMAEGLKESFEEYYPGTFENIRSWMGIPLIMKERVIGVLTVDHELPDFYNSQHVFLGMAFANQAAIEYENARLYNETIQKADELKTMFAVQQAITSRLDKDAVLQLIADESRRLTNAGRTAVFMVENEELVLSVFSGKDSRKFLGYRMPMDKSHLGKTLMAGKSEVINDTAKVEESVQKGLIQEAQVKSFLSVPLMAGERPIGVIAVVDKINGGFGAEDERILSLLASAAVIGLENSRLYEEEQRRHMEDQRRRSVAEGLRDLLSVLNSNRPMSEVFDYIINQAVRMMNTDTGALYRLEKDKDLLTIEASRGLTGEYTSSMSVPLGMGVVGRAVIQRQPVVEVDMSRALTLTGSFYDDPGRKPLLDWLAERCKGMLAVPLFCKDEVYGGIVLYYSEAKDFTGEEIDLAMAFADQAALAIDNARLRAQSQEIAVAAERSRLARDLHDAVTQTLFSASLIAEVLPKIWKRNQEEGLKRLDELRQLTRGALAEMRTLLLELRPATLAESGLKELLTHLTQAFGGRARIPANLAIEGQSLLPVDVKIAIYRIAQEALNNIAKHSGATEVEINLTAGPQEEDGTGTVELRIKDNGKGFEPCNIPADHLGLGIMRERAEAAGAKLWITSSTGMGTEVKVMWKGREKEEWE